MEVDNGPQPLTVRSKQQAVTEFLLSENVAPLDIHRRMRAFYDEKCVDLNTVHRWAQKCYTQGFVTCDPLFEFVAVDETTSEMGANFHEEVVSELLDVEISGTRIKEEIDLGIELGESSNCIVISDSESASSMKQEYDTLEEGNVIKETPDSKFGQLVGNTEDCVTAVVYSKYGPKINNSGNFRLLKDPLSINFVKRIREKEYSCAYSEYRCFNDSVQAGHMRTHTGEQPFSCTACGYKCAQKKNLTKHMRSHTGEKLFLCTYCEYRSSRKSILVKHLRTHTGEKPYSCSLCEYRTSVKSNLIPHMRIHTGEKPFTCSVCDYRCSKKFSLQVHKKKHSSVTQSTFWAN